MATPITYPLFKAFVPGSTLPLSGGLVYFYDAGTDTPQDTYDTALRDSANPNPVVLDANGEAIIFPGDDAFKIILKDSDGVTLWTQDNLTTAGQLPGSVSGHNLLMNGGFEIWQPGTSFVGAASVQLTDGWAARISGGSGAATDYTITRQASNRDGSVYALRIQRNAASTASLVTNLVQNIETLDAVAGQDLYLALSFYARIGAGYSGVGFDPHLYSGTGTDEAWQTAGSITGQTQLTLTSLAQPAFSTNWQKFSYVTGVLMPVGATELSLAIQVANSWSGTAGANDYIEFDDVQIELGSTPTAIDRESFAQALYRVQRRYYKSFPYSVAPVQNGGVNGAYIFGQVVAAVTVMGTPGVQMPRHMRDVAGTLTLFNPSAANAQARNTTVGADCSATSGVTSSNEIHLTVTTAAGSAAGSVNAVHYTIDKRI